MPNTIQALKFAQVNSDQTDLVIKLIRIQQETLSQLNTLLSSQSRHTTNDSHGIRESSLSKVEQAKAELNAPQTNTPHIDDKLLQIAKLKAQLWSLQRQLATQNDQRVEAPEGFLTYAQNDQLI